MVEAPVAGVADVADVASSCSVFRRAATDAAREAATCLDETVVRQGPTVWMALR